MSGRYYSWGMWVGDIHVTLKSCGESKMSKTDMLNALESIGNKLRRDIAKESV